MKEIIAVCCKVIAWAFVLLVIAYLFGIFFGNGFTGFWESLGLGHSSSSIRTLNKLSVIFLGGAATLFFKLADKIKKM